MENMFVCILVSGACGCAAPSGRCQKHLWPEGPRPPVDRLGQSRSGMLVGFARPLRRNGGPTLSLGPLSSINSVPPPPRRTLRSHPVPVPVWAAGGWKCQGRFLIPVRHCREGSPSRRSYEGCATIVYPTSKTVSAIWPKCMGVHSLIWPSVLKAYGSFKCVCKIELYVMSDLSDKSEQKYSQQIFMSDQSVFAAQFASDVNAQLPVTSDNSYFYQKVMQNAQRKCCALAMLRYPSWDCSHVIGWKLRRHLIGYRKFIGWKKCICESSRVRGVSKIHI